MSHHDRKHGIFCTVDSCVHNCDGEACDLSSIEVGSCGCEETGRASDSMCCSYRHD